MITMAKPRQIAMKSGTVPAVPPTDTITANLEHIDLNRGSFTASLSFCIGQTSTLSVVLSAAVLG